MGDTHLAIPAGVRWASSKFPEQEVERGSLSCPCSHPPGLGEPLGKLPGITLVDEPGYTKPMDTGPRYRPRTAMGSRAWLSECSRLIRPPHPHSIRQVRLECGLKPSIKLKGTSSALCLSFQVMLGVARAGAVPAPQKKTKQGPRPMACAWAPALCGSRGCHHT